MIGGTDMLTTAVRETEKNVDHNKNSNECVNISGDIFVPGLSLVGNYQNGNSHYNLYYQKRQKCDPNTTNIYLRSRFDFIFT